MRKLIGLFLGLMLLALPRAEASVSNMTSQLGVYNSTDTQYGLEVDNNNLFKFAPTTSSIYYPGVIGGTTNQTLTANQSGQTIILNNSTYDRVIFTLPTAVVGMQYTLVIDVAKNFRVDPQNADIINYSTATAGQRIASTSASKGDSVTLYCAVAGFWSLVDHNGTWVVDPFQN